jgi:predicted transcriptional regulator
MVGDLVERVFRGSPRMLVAHALEQTDPSPRELDELQQLIDQYRARQQSAADEDQ